jgi:hypothetical protein
MGSSACHWLQPLGGRFLGPIFHIKAAGSANPNTVVGVSSARLRQRGDGVNPARADFPIADPGRELGVMTGERKKAFFRPRSQD